MRHCSEHSGNLAPSHFDTALARLEERFNELVSDREAAPPLLERLLAMPQSQRLLAARSQQALHTPAIAELLVEESSQSGPGSALDVARLAVAVADRLDPDRYSASLVHDLRARAWGQLAEARRLGGDLRGAGLALAIAERLAEDGSADPLEEAHLLELRAAQLADLGELEAATELLRLAAETYESVADGPRSARARLAAEDLDAMAAMGAMSAMRLPRSSAVG